MSTKKLWSFPLAAAALLVLLQSAPGSAGAISPTLAPGAHATGGVSSEGREEMQTTQDLYNLRLTFAEARSGAYLAGVTVTIEPEGRGTSFGPFADCGPLFFMVLSPGVYRINATYGGVARSTTVRIGKGATRATLYWPEV